MNASATVQFEYEGVHHLALVCNDMERTVDFYTNVLGMPLIKGFDLTNDMGQHFFFDLGGGNLLAFFWFPDAQAAPGPGVVGMANLPSRPRSGRSLASSHGSMNHIAFKVAADKIDEYRQALLDKGVDITVVLNHEDVESGPGVDRVSDVLDDKTWIRSAYFRDPDGIALELCADIKPGTPEVTEPMNAKGLKASER
jgi:catechol 2,3-dioxygenase-like lactoylglutathione lyase family enzyme